MRQHVLNGPDGIDAAGVFDHDGQSSPVRSQREASPILHAAIRSRRVCMTCHWFRHHAGVNCIPVLTCQLHQGLIAHGEHLASRCQGWADDQVRQRGWAPERA